MKYTTIEHLNSLSSTTDMLILDPLVIILAYIYAFKTNIASDSSRKSYRWIFFFHI